MIEIKQDGSVLGEDGNLSVSLIQSIFFQSNCTISVIVHLVLDDVNSFLVNAHW
jgi:hypothetical protein